MKTAIGASLPEDLYQEFILRAKDFPGGKTGLIKEALRAYFSTAPAPAEQAAEPLSAADQSEQMQSQERD